MLVTKRQLLRLRTTEQISPRLLMEICNFTHDKKTHPNS